MALSKDRLYTLISIIFLLILTFAIYLQIENHEFLILDDPIYVTANQYVKSGLKLENVYWAFTSFEAEFWHPVTWISYMIDTQVYGVVPGGYLLTNLFIHLLNSILVFILFELMTKKRWESFLISALFALHPLHVESVAWIAERKELLCGFFWFLSTIVYYYYTNSPNWKRYCLILIFFVLGMMSKTMIVTLPFTFLLLDFWPLERVSFANTNSYMKWIPLISEKIPLFLISVAGIAITLFAQNKGGGLVSLEKYSIYQRIANSIVSYVIYIKKTIWPTNLSVFYPVKDIASFVIVISVLFFIILSCLIIYYSKKYKFLIVGWFWFIGTLIPVIGIIKIGDFSMADRYTYIPLIGLFVIFSFGIKELVSRSVYEKFWLIAIPIIILGCYVPNTFYQIKIWENTETLINHSLKVVDNNFLAHNALGEMAAGKGDMKEAIFHFKRGVEIEPDNSALWVKLGRALYSVNLISKAIYSFEKALTLDQKHPAPHFYLLCSFLDKDDNNQAQKHFIFMFEKNNLLVNSKDFLQFKTYLEQEELKKADIIFEILLRKIGVIVAKQTFQSLIVQGHKTWETKYLKKGQL